MPQSRIQRQRHVSRLRAMLVHTREPVLHDLGLLVIERERAEAVLDQAVTEARRAGHTWETIADILGITRQSAQTRYGS
jgi:hypothetical protein